MQRSGAIAERNGVQLEISLDVFSGRTLLRSIPYYTQCKYKIKTHTNKKTNSVSEIKKAK